MTRGHAAFPCLGLALVGVALLGCTTNAPYESMNLETITGKIKQEIIALEGEPVSRTDRQLVYAYETGRTVTPIWVYILLAGVAGDGPDLDFTDRDFYCLTPTYEDSVLVGHSLSDRAPEDG